jgi:hypothetical protein
MIKLHVEKGVFKVYNGLAKAACDWLQKTQRIPHKLEVLFITRRLAMKLRWSKRLGSDAVGYFSPERPVGILLRQRRFSECHFKMSGRQFRHPLDKVLYTIMHEFVHYEQFRDKKPINHRNVESRAKHLMRQFKETL